MLNTWQIPHRQSHVPRSQPECPPWEVLESALQLIHWLPVCVPIHWQSLKSWSGQLTVEQSLMTSTKSSCFMAAGRNMVSGLFLARIRDLRAGPYDSEVSSCICVDWSGPVDELAGALPASTSGLDTSGSGTISASSLDVAGSTGGGTGSTTAGIGEERSGFSGLDCLSSFPTSLTTSCSCGGYD